MLIHLDTRAAVCPRYDDAAGGMLAEAPDFHGALLEQRDRVCVDCRIAWEDALASPVTARAYSTDRLDSIARRAIGYALRDVDAPDDARPAFYAVAMAGAYLGIAGELDATPDVHRDTLALAAMRSAAAAVDAYQDTRDDREDDALLPPPASPCQPGGMPEMRLRTTARRVAA